MKDNVINSLLRLEIPTGYERQLSFYKKNLQALVKTPLSEGVANKLIGTLILMCHDQTGKDLHTIYKEFNIILEEEKTIEKEIDELVCGLNQITSLNHFNVEQQIKRMLFNYLILLNIVRMQRRLAYEY